MSHQQEYLDEFLCFEALLPANISALCDTCEEDGVFHCKDCFRGEAMCRGCILQRHADCPLHFLQVCGLLPWSRFTTDSLLKHWNGTFFESTTLTALGNTVQLGYAPGDPCLVPSGLHDLMVFDLNGVHRVIVRYCHCAASGDGFSHRIQLLRARWFPATVVRPSTAFTFQLLDFFHKLQDHNKCNPYDFYHTIIQRTDNAGLNPEIVSSLVAQMNKISNILTVQI